MKRRLMYAIPLRWRILGCRATLLFLLVVGIVPFVIFGALCGAWMALSTWTVRLVYAIRNLEDEKGW